MQVIVEHTKVIMREISVEGSYEGRLKELEKLKRKGEDSN